jgi:hypothetical protein
LLNDRGSKGGSCRAMNMNVNINSMKCYLR